jgi:long-chain acyl-CoA synthetase
MGCGSFPRGSWGALLDDAVAAYGQRPCTYFMGKRLSFTEIGELSERAAKGLQKIGVGEGVKVGLLLPNTPTFVVFYYGVLKAGGTVVNFNPLYSVEEIECQARDSGTKIMVTLDLALTFDKVEALIERGVLDKAVVRASRRSSPAEIGWFQDRATRQACRCERLSGEGQNRA